MNSRIRYDIMAAKYVIGPVAIYTPVTPSNPCPTPQPKPDSSHATGDVTFQPVHPQKNAAKDKDAHTETTSKSVTDLRCVFPEVAVFKRNGNDALFQGRNLPAFVKDYILRRFSDENGQVGEDALRNYLTTKMPTDKEDIKGRLLKGEKINITTRVVFETEMSSGTVKFELPDAGVTSDAIVDAALIANAEETIFDGEQWGNVTLIYHAPESRKKGYISMTGFRPFEPYKINLEAFTLARRQFTLEQWIDALIAIMGYEPSRIEGEDVKLEYIARMLPFVEPRLNMIELGPKSTGKSHLYNNFSKRGWCISGGKISRAKLFFNKTTRKFGLLKHYDVVAIDEISSFSFADPDEMQSAFKAYLEAGKCTVDNTVFQSECGLTLMGNILLDEERKPIDINFYKTLPAMLQESATLDRFHSFVEGWKLPRIEVGLIHEGWTLDAEYFSSILHALREEGCYSQLFDDIVEYEPTADLRDLKAVKKVATAFTKLLFPHVKSVKQLTPEALIRFKDTYNKYCLQPAIARRAIIRTQCHAIDREFTPEMPTFTIK